jgi:hypothetical protein
MKSRQSDAAIDRLLPSAMVRVGADLSTDNGISLGEVAVDPPHPLSKRMDVIARKLHLMPPP